MDRIGFRMAALQQDAVQLRINRMPKSLGCFLIINGFLFCRSQFNFQFPGLSVRIDRDSSQLLGFILIPVECEFRILKAIVIRIPGQPVIGIIRFLDDIYGIDGEIFIGLY